LAYEQKLKKIASNAWEVGGRKMRLMEIRQLAKDHGFRIRTTTAQLNSRKSYTDDVFVVFEGGNANDSAALLWKLGQEPTEARNAPTKQHNQFKYITSKGVEKWLDARNHSRLQGVKHKRRRGVESLSYKDGSGSITKESWTGETRQVEKEFWRLED